MPADGLRYLLLVCVIALPCPVRSWAWVTGRHIYAAWLLEQSVSPKVVQTMLGHSRIAMTLDIYSHVGLDLEKQAAAKLNAALTSGLR